MAELKIGEFSLEN